MTTNNPTLLMARINELTKIINKPSLSFMEVCGTHTMSIYRNGLGVKLKPMIRFVSGPGCPVCVTAAGTIDAMIALAQRPNTIVATFGDMLKVPGSVSSLQQERSRGARVVTVYSPLEAVTLAQTTPDSEVVFLGIGFETTLPVIGAALKTAIQLNLPNFSVLTAFKAVIPAVQALLSNKRLGLDGLLLPGHASVIIGANAYRFITQDYHTPVAIAGFEPGEILQGVVCLLEQIAQQAPAVQNCYQHWVSDTGNQTAQRLIEEMYELHDVSWRGLGTIPASGYTLRTQYHQYDAWEKFGVSSPQIPESPGCRCGEILTGLIIPPECPLFGESCNPSHPIGPCMVSSEGACAAAYKYQQV